MNLNVFMKPNIKLGKLYALAFKNQNGKRTGNGYYHGGYSPARAELSALHSYLTTLDTEVLGVVLFGSAVKMPWTETVKRKKWMFFGPYVEHVVQKRVNVVDDFDIAIFTKSSQPQASVPQRMISVYEGMAISCSGMHLICLTTEDYLHGLSNNDSVCLSIRDKGVVIVSNDEFKHHDIGNPEISVKWSMNNSGYWNCEPVLDNHSWWQ